MPYMQHVGHIVIYFVHYMSNYILWNIFTMTGVISAFILQITLYGTSIRKHKLLTVLFITSGYIIIHYGSRFARALEIAVTYDYSLVRSYAFGGRNCFGGILLVIIWIELWCRIGRLNRRVLFDRLAISLPIIYLFARLGCFFAGDGCYGIRTESMLGMTFPHGIFPTLQKVYPTPLFEAVASAILVLILGITYRNKQQTGKLFGVSILGVSVIRFLIEFIRTNPLLMFLSQAQWISIVFVVYSISFMRRKYIPAILLFSFAITCNANSQSLSGVFSLKGSHIYQKPTREVILQTLTPEEAFLSSSLTDNSYLHFASAYSGILLLHDTSYAITLEPTVETRGSSYGALNNNTTVIFLKTDLYFNASLPSLHDSARLQAYYFVNKYLNNIEIADYKGLLAEAFSFGLFMRYFSIYFVEIPDLSNTVGMNIGDSQEYSFIYYLNNSFVPRSTIKAFMRYEKILDPKYYKLRFGFQIDYSVRFAQISAAFTHLADTKYSNEGKQAIYISCTGNYSLRKDNISARISALVKYRYYGFNFNKDIIDHHIIYRDTKKFLLYGNTMGASFIPIEYYYMEPDNWMYYTEYQDNTIQSIYISPNTTLCYDSVISLEMQYSGRIIRAGKDIHIDSYYGIYLSYNVNKYCTVRGGITNKYLTYDWYYPKFITTKYPSLLLDVNWCVP